MRQCIVICISIVVLFAAPGRSKAVDPASDPDAFEKGRAVAVGANVGATESACFRCHGMEGQGDAAAVFPRLSSQPAEYLYNALKDYASGVRNNAVMTPIARMLNDAQMKHVAVFYARQRAEPQVRSDKVQDIQLLQRGAAIAAVGNAERSVQGCINCHGPEGRGLAPTYPALAGQYERYIEAQLRAWRSGERKSVRLSTEVMEYIAKQLSEEDIRAVALYYASIVPPTSGASDSARAIRPLPNTPPLPRPIRSE